MEANLKSGKLSLGTKFAYGTADFGIAMVTAAIQFVLFFYYNKVLGMDPALVGTALLVGKLTWDAINDPLVGTCQIAPAPAGGGANPTCFSEPFLLV